MDDQREARVERIRDGRTGRIRNTITYGLFGPTFQVSYVEFDDSPQWHRVLTARLWGEYRAVSP
jgi:hypothetical protein